MRAAEERGLNGMKLNGTINVEGFFQEGDRTCIEVSGATLAEASALDGQTLEVTQDGEGVLLLSGYTISLIEKAGGGSLRIWCDRSLPDATRETIESLERRVSEAEAKAEEAAEIASQAGTDPQVRAAAAMYANATPLTNTQLTSLHGLIEEFVPGRTYEKGLVRSYEGAFYRMAKDIDAQTSTTYQPGAGTESLYTLIDLAPDGTRVWHMPTCAEDGFVEGERAHYPDADGPVYVSMRDGNTSEPAKDEWWALAEGGDAR